MLMDRLAYGASVLACTIGTAWSVPALAANVTALQGSICPAGQLICLVGDNNWNTMPFKEVGYDAAKDMVTGFGIYSTTTTGAGSEAIYLLSGKIVAGILTIDFQTGKIAGNERVKIIWQGDDNGLIDLGNVPSGATTVRGTGGVQGLTELLNDLGTFPSGLTVQATAAPLSSPSSVPEPSSLLLLGVGLGGAAVIRQRSEG